MFEVTQFKTGRQTRREALATFRDVGLVALIAMSAVGLSGDLPRPEHKPDITGQPGRQYLVRQGSYAGDYLSHSEYLLPGMLSDLGELANRDITQALLDPAAGQLLQRLAGLPLSTSFAALEQEAAHHGLFLGYGRGVAAYQDRHTGIVYDAFLPLLMTMPPEAADRLTQTITDSPKAEVGVGILLDQAGNRMTMLQVG